MNNTLRLILAAFMAVAIAVGTMSQRVSASTTIGQAFQTSQTGEAARLTLSGQGMCQVTLNQQAPGTVLTPQESYNGGVSWQVVPTIGGGSISQTGVYLGTIDGTVNPLFRVYVASVSGTITGTIVCGDNAPLPLYNGGSGGGNTIVAGTCTSPSPVASPTGGVGVNYICNTPAPLYAGVCTSPVPTGAPSGIAVNYTCPQGASPNPFESAIIARTDVTHFWQMHAATTNGGPTPGPCASAAGSFTDTPTATAAPSAVSLGVVISAGNPPITCQMPDILPNNGGKGSVGFCYGGGGTLIGCQGLTTGQLHNSYLTIPSSVDPAAPFTVFCIVKPNLILNQENDFWNREQSTNLKLDYSTAGVLSFIVTAGVHNNSGNNPTAAFVVLTEDGTTTTLYQNGIPITEPTVAPAAPVPTGGTFGATLDGTSKDFSGQLEDCGYANTVWSLGTVQYLYSLTGL